MGGSSVILQHMYGIGGVAEGTSVFRHGYVQSETLHDKQDKSILSKLHVPLLYHHDYTGFALENPGF